MDFSADFRNIKQDLDMVCQHCDVCLKKDCLIGYAKYMLKDCEESGSMLAPGAFENIPPADMKSGYDEYNVLYAIAHLTKRCHACKENHKTDCLINVVRSCYEVITFGEEQEFDGIPLGYIMNMNRLHGEKGQIITEEYQKLKNEEA